MKENNFKNWKYTYVLLVFGSLKPWISLSAAISAEAMREGTT